MTILESIIGSIYPYAVDEALILKTCIDYSLDEAEEYTLAVKENVARATISILQNIVTLSGENRGGDSMSYNVDNIKERIYHIAISNGLTDISEEYKPHSRLTDKTDMW